MNDNNKPYQETHISISSDEFDAGHRALRVISLAVFLFQHAGRESIESAGHDVGTLVDLIEDHITSARSCFEQPRRR